MINDQFDKSLRSPLYAGMNGDGSKAFDQPPCSVSPRPVQESHSAVVGLQVQPLARVSTTSSAAMQMIPRTACGCSMLILLAGEHAGWTS